MVTSQPKTELISSLDSKVLMISPQETISTVPALGDCTAELRDDGNLYISYKPSKVKVADILSHINQAGIIVKDLSTVEADLEDVFMQMTYGRDEQG